MTTGELHNKLFEIELGLIKAKDALPAVEEWAKSQYDGKPIVIRSLPTQDEILAEADKYGFRVPYDGSNNFYDDEAIKHFLAGINWYRSAIEVGNAV